MLSIGPCTPCRRSCCESVGGLEPAELIRPFTFEFWQDSFSAADRERVAPRLADGRGLFVPTNADGSPAVADVSHPQGIAAGIEPYELLIERARRDLGHAPAFPVKKTVEEALRDRSELPFAVYHVPHPSKTLDLLK